MTLPQLKQKVQENGPTRAYLTRGEIENDEIFYRGQRGDLIFEGGFLCFYSDADNIPFLVEWADGVHAPAINHYSWT